jgi:hypothetical protein
MASAPKNAPAPTAEKRKSPVPGVVCLLITAAILIAGLWPFEFNPVNKVEWVQNGSGIRFYGQGIVFSPEPLLIQHIIARNAAITLEFLVRPNKEISTMVASMLTYTMANRTIHFVMEKELIIRIPAVKAEIKTLSRDRR